MTQCHSSEQLQYNIIAISRSSFQIDRSIHLIFCCPWSANLAIKQRGCDLTTVLSQTLGAERGVWLHISLGILCLLSFNLVTDIIVLLDFNRFQDGEDALTGPHTTLHVC